MHCTRHGFRQILILNAVSIHVVNYCALCSEREKNMWICAIPANPAFKHSTSCVHQLVAPQNKFLIKYFGS